MKESDLNYLLGDSKTVSVRCLQWGDTGKGKIVDLLAPWADIIVRCTGGNNAGHTIYIDGKKIILHLVPSAIAEDCNGKETIIGPGTVIYPKSFIEELSFLEAEGLSYKNLKISLRAKLILPTHLVEDRIKEIYSEKGKIGTTGKGIGPAYADHVSRIGLTMNDLLNKDLFAIRLKKHLEKKALALRGYNEDDIYEIMQSDDLERGAFFDKENIFNFEAIYNEYLLMAEKLRPMICDTDKYLRGQVGKKNILLEGAQGMLLSIDYGTYPFVTSSDPSLEGMAKGAGINYSDVDIDFVIVKGFMETRVGNGPFPTELGGIISENYCAITNREKEMELYPCVDINSNNDFIQGIALRREGQEFGATTSRLRRTGWLDLLLFKYALLYSSPKTKLVMTKLDVLSKCKEIKICTGYRYAGPDFYYGEKLVVEGDFITEACMDSSFLNFCDPSYVVFPGWEEDISSVRDFQDFPENLKNILNFVLSEIGKEDDFIKIISIGPQRSETVFL